MSTIQQRLLADPRVESISDERHEGSGIWVYVVRGYCDHAFLGEGVHCAQGCVHSVHERTWREIERTMRYMQACNCARCVPGGA